MLDRAGAFDPRWFAEAAGGDLAKASDTVLERIETDSRSAGPGALFVALKGERSDGHDFVRAAASSGADAALVSGDWYRERGRRELEGITLSVIVADDPLAALQRAAKAWRSLFTGLLRFGVTGSSGKTTVKELLAAVLGVSRPIVKNPGNLNSDIGLPASIFLIRPEHKAAVFELGINHLGEMDVLTEIYEPDCAIINTIGSAHIGLLGGTRESICAEKKKITSRFDGRQRLLVREDDEFRDFLMRDVKGECLCFGPRSLAGFRGAKNLGLDGWSMDYEGQEIHLSLPGAHNLMNALAALGAASLYGATVDDARTGLESVRPLSGRSEIVRGPITIVNDCYNANAESVLAAITFCDDVYVSGRRVYVLGSMKELGEETEAAHRRVGRAAASSKAEILLFYGDEMKVAINEVAACAPEMYARHFNDYDSLAAATANLVRAGDLVLLKASRSMALERLTERLTSAGGPHAS
ncbi:MAG: UDP-N-acetylmuramoyl-tripeptide--D-alanyl-D-alanine ligase [Spirochaetales bacterium]|nr:MAG: UDP-N-acetylmuramoyl-tripeptide--D-alanyl-D-alanine ligase [Spirochaetales bacterium]